MLFAGAVHPHGSIARPIIIHTVCICQFFARTFHPTFTQWGAFRPPPPPANRKIRAAGRPPPSGGQTGSARFGGSAAGPAARTPRKLFPHKLPPNRQKHPAGTAPPGDAFAVFGYLTRTSSYLRVPTPIFSACSRQIRQSVSGELLVKWSWWSQKPSAAMLSASWLSGSGC